MSSNSDTLCPLAWTSLAYYPNGSYTVCCRSRIQLGSTPQEALRSEKLKEVKKEMQQGTRPLACKRCFEEEDLGITSMRQSRIQMYSRLGIKVEYESLEHSLKSYDLRLSNLCNLKCRMCWPFSSSKIYSEYLELLENGIRMKMYENAGEPFWPPTIVDAAPTVEHVLENAPQLRHLYISGGEPFLDTKLVGMLEALAKTGAASDIRLDIHTNGTIWNESLMQCLDAFRSTTLMISLDGIGKALEYQRTGSRWEAIENNIRKILEAARFQVTFLPTVTIYNVLYMDELLSWYLELKKEFPEIQVSMNFLLGPEYLMAHLMSPSGQVRLLDKLDRLKADSDQGYNLSIEKLKNIKRIDISPSSAELIKQLKKVTNVIDDHRKQYLQDYLPESAQMLEEMSALAHQSL